MTSQKKSNILKSEIHFPFRNIVCRIPNSLICCIATICVAICFIHPVFITLFALHKKSIDFPFIYYMRFTRECLYPFIGYIGGVAVLISFAKFYYSSDRAIKIRRNKTIILFVLMAILIFVSTCINGWDYLARFGTWTMGQSAMIEISYFVLLFPLAMMVTDCKWKYILLRSFVLTSAFLSISAFFLWKSQISSKFIQDWQPVFSCIHINPNYYGYYLSVSVSLSAAMICAESYHIWKYISILCMIINTVALSYNNTMGAWVGEIFAIIFIVVTYRIRDGFFNHTAWKVLLLFFITFVVSGLINGCLLYNFASLFSDLGVLIIEPGTEEAMQAGSGRWIIWMKSLTLIERHPLFGIGFEGIMSNKLTDYVGNNRPHNEYMEYTLFYGIPAGIVYFIGCLSVFLRGLKYQNRLDNITLAALTSAFGYLVSAFFGLTVYNTAPYMFIMLGLGYVRDN